MRKYLPQGLKNIYHFFVALLANLLYGFPSRQLKVIGVTGTDGKTTTASLIAAILKEAGKNVGLVTSISAKIGEKEYDTGFHVTSPDPSKLQKFLKKMVEAGCEYAVLEVTSHGLEQHRFFGVNFSVGVLTNITQEHLDYHKTYENYVKAKVRLFKKVEYSILNGDDPSEKIVSKEASGKIIRYALNSRADLTPKSFESTVSSQTIHFEGFEIETKLLGEYNTYNILAAVVAADALGISQEKTRRAIEKFKPLVGRFEVIDEGQDFTVVVDFAHTPNALEAVLNLSQKLLDIPPKDTSDVSEGVVTAQNTFDPPDGRAGPPTSRAGVSRGRIIVVFGCAGLRDFTKRSKMGEIACRLADFTVLTAEDPRTEDVNTIIDQITQGCLKAGGKEGKSFFRIPDRKEAIKFALLKLAKKGDLVIITGKGHEKSMCFGTTEYPWSDQDTVRETLSLVRYREVL